FPILRVLLPPDRLVEELRRAGEGALVRLPRAAFEEKVRRAARVAAAERNAPRLVEARYRARLEGDNLLGSAEWKLIHPGAGAGALDLEPLGLAVRQGRWEDGAPLLIGPFPPGPPPEAPAPGGPPAPEAPAQRLKL